jgi:hypothetical protein
VDTPKKPTLASYPELKVVASEHEIEQYNPQFPDSL